MSTAFDSIKRGLTQAIAHQKGKTKGVKTHAPAEVDGQALRNRSGCARACSSNSDWFLARNAGIVFTTIGFCIVFDT
ncbi:MAG: hypothetical protein EXR29_13220 [Betaproteobacteria bacterium]|nr:hypothetical protein [Betaproteobacteria bacterium]